MSNGENFCHVTGTVGVVVIYDHNAWGGRWPVMYGGGGGGGGGGGEVACNVYGGGGGLSYNCYGTGGMVVAVWVGLETNLDFF